MAKKPHTKNHAQTDMQRSAIMAVAALVLATSAVFAQEFVVPNVTGPGNAPVEVPRPDVTLPPAAVENRPDDAGSGNGSSGGSSSNGESGSSGGTTEADDSSDGGESESTRDATGSNGATGGATGGSGRSQEGTATSPDATGTVPDASATAPVEVYVPPALSALCVAGTRIKLPSDEDPRTQWDSTVYLCGRDGKRYAFITAADYRSWFKDFDGVISVPPRVMSQIPVGGSVVRATLGQRIDRVLHGER